MVNYCIKPYSFGRFFFILVLGILFMTGCENEPSAPEEPPASESQTGIAEKSFSETFAGGRLAGISNLEEIYKDAVNGDYASQLCLGEALVNTGKTQEEKAEGVEWIRKAAKFEDNQPAYYSLGMCYLEGNGVEQDETEAFKWFQKEPPGPFPRDYQLALCYLEGRGTEQDHDAGIERLRKLAEHGYEDAKVKLKELGEE